MSDITYHEEMPGEDFLVSGLQKKISLSVGERVIKRGRLILFKKVHYFIQLCIVNEKNVRENMEIPLPFDIEIHKEENLMYFDYRVSALKVKSIPPIPDKVSSSFFNKILEISFS